MAARHYKRPKPTRTPDTKEAAARRIQALGSSQLDREGDEQYSRLRQVAHGEASRAGGGYRVLRAHHGDY